jgi:hypothetical protein
LYRNASPFFGFPGVVVNGKVFRNETYVEDSFEVKKFDMVRICEGTRVETERSEGGMRGLRGGQFGGVDDGDFDGGGLAECFFGAIVEATFRM